MSDDIVKVTESGIVMVPDNSISTAKIQDASVTLTKLASNSVDASKIVDGSVTTAELADGAVTVAKTSGLVSAATVGNLLTTNLANGSETGTITGLGTWGGSGLPYEGTVASSTAQAKSGTRSIALTANAAFANISLADIAVTVGQTYTFSVQMRSDQASGELARLQLQWINAGGGTVDTLVSSDISITSAGWTRFILTAVAPATAVGARGFLVRTSGAVGAVAYFDEIGFWEGAGGQWSLPGSVITNLGFYTDESVGRRLFQWDANNSRWQMTFGDTGWRDVTGSLESGATAGAWEMRRVNSTVSHRIYNAENGYAVIYTLPVGFSPLGNTASSVPLSQGDGTTGALVVSGARGCSLAPVGFESYAAAFYVPTYTTTDAWPTSLPGTAVGSIPA